MLFYGGKQGSSATGYIGRHIVNACLEQGHPTFVQVRPEAARDVEKVQLVLSFRRAGAKIFWVSLDDHDELVKLLKQVDVVICTVSHFHLEQYKLINAIKEAGNIKKFYPSEFGTDVDRNPHIPPGDKLFTDKVAIRRTVEALGIPYTYISANCFMGFFLASFAQLEPLSKFFPPRDSVVIHGDGNVKIVWMAEKDIGTYTAKSIDDPRTLNRTVYFRPPKNVLTMNEQVAIWESKIGKALKKSYLSEKELFAKYIQDEKHPWLTRAAPAHMYEIFHRGDLYFDFGPDDLEASVLYPEMGYTTTESYLELFV
ncbi:hypothetical protein SELMODRAFT_414678 [Selaginella moellendorffii]|uniref:NmrA-like domain-containing protein n=1 Tax=Selaginella moellendorffii TaxID=88036 RepID=D8RTK1_SELML|nr:bifunctional pinoresinol-lariciresinol reductase 1 [Selaginella moellendorffii]EFJ24689.1 hypothetical protein SELMODRAFT_414678 [Selaginella moellendorffii]|eukprot:XP_002974467.1 bifunctional pinoresinol-lariciresinol reductase 1 [Selaginella moellendorffii]